MRIAMVAACPFPSPQGSQVFVREMCTGLAGRGHDVTLLTYGQGEAYDEAGEAGARMDGVRHVRVRRLPGDDAMRSGPTPAKPMLDALMVVALSRLLGEARFDAVHCHNYEAALVGLAARVRRGVPVVYHSHNLMADELPTYFASPAAKRAAARIGLTLDRHVPRRADHTIALCDFTATILRGHGVARDRITVAPPAVALEPAADDAHARRRLGVPGDRLVIGYCGNLDAYQNLPLLLDAVAVIRREGSGPAPLLLVATHAGDPRFDALVRERGLDDCVHVVAGSGFAPIRRAMAASDVVALPRRLGSGLPIKLVNCMALGLPIVAAGCGGKVLTDGVDGRVVPDDDPEAFAAAIAELGTDSDLAGRLGEGARRTYLSSFTWDALLDVMESVYEGLERP